MSNIYRSSETILMLTFQHASPSRLPYVFNQVLLERLNQPSGMEWYFASSSAAFALSFVLQLKFHLYGDVAVGTTGPCAPCVLSFCCSAFCLSFLSPSLAPCTQESVSGQLHS